MADITILGAGIFGLSIAWALVQRGAAVQVIDPRGVGRGASGGTVGALAPHVPENWNDKKQFQLDSLLMAQGFWADVTAAAGQSVGYARSGRLQPLADQAAVDLARLRGQNATTLWQGQARWQVLAAADLPNPDWAPPSPSGFYVWDDLSARIDPRRACTALAAALRARGVQINKEGTPSGVMIHATGWEGLSQISAQQAQVFGNGVKGQSALLAFDAGAAAPQLFAHSLHIVPHDNGTVAIGSTSERDFTTPDQTDDQLDQIIETARQIFPVLADAPVIDRWAGVRPRAKSRAPVLGAHPLIPDAFIANGGFKIGFGMAPKVAQVMADLVLTGQADIPPGFLPNPR